MQEKIARNDLIFFIHVSVHMKLYTDKPNYLISKSELVDKLWIHQLAHSLISTTSVVMHLSNFSKIALVIIENGARWLVKNFVLSRYNRARW